MYFNKKNFIILNASMCIILIILTLYILKSPLNINLLTTLIIGMIGGALVTLIIIYTIVEIKE